MPFERSAELVSGLDNGYTIYGVRRIYSITLTPGSNDTTAILSWTSAHFGGTRMIHLRADSSSSSTIYQPGKPLVVDGNPITLTITGTSPKLALTVAGYSAVKGPSSSLVCQISVNVGANIRNLQSRTTILKLTGKDFTGRTTILKPTSRDMVIRVTVTSTKTSRELVSRLISLVESTSDLVASMDVIAKSSKDLVCSITTPKTATTKDLVGSVISLIESSGDLVGNITSFKESGTDLVCQITKYV